jgi:hypothetical protein
MYDKEWLEQELEKERKYEIEAARRVIKLREEMIKVKAEFAAAKEYLEGVRGMIRVFEFEVDSLALNESIPGVLSKEEEGGAA